MSADEHIDPLPYANPPVFFRGEYRCRNARTIVAVLVMTCAGIGAAWLWSFMLRRTVVAIQRHVVAPMVFAFGCVCLLGAAHSLWGWVTNRRWEVLINEDGITRDGKLWTWDQISQLGASLLANNRVVMQFHLRSAWRPTLPRALELTPGLTLEQYEALSAQLVQYLQARYPHVIISQAMRG